LHRYARRLPDKRLSFSHFENRFFQGRVCRFERLFNQMLIIDCLVDKIQQFHDQNVPLLIQQIIAQAGKREILLEA
jgi:hypothetical protein